MLFQALCDTAAARVDACAKLLDVALTGAAVETTRVLRNDGMCVSLSIRLADVNLMRGAPLRTLHDLRGESPLRATESLPPEHIYEAETSAFP